MVPQQLAAETIHFLTQLRRSQRRPINLRGGLLDPRDFSPRADEVSSRQLVGQCAPSKHGRGVRAPCPNVHLDLPLSKPRPKLPALSGPPVAAPPPSVASQPALPRPLEPRLPRSPPPSDHETPDRTAREPQSPAPAAHPLQPRDLASQNRSHNGPGRSNHIEHDDQQQTDDPHLEVRNVSLRGVMLQRPIQFVSEVRSRQWRLLDWRRHPMSPVVAPSPRPLKDSRAARTILSTDNVLTTPPPSPPPSNARASHPRHPSVPSRNPVAPTDPGAPCRPDHPCIPSPRSTPPSPTTSHQPLATCPQIVYTIRVSLATRFPMLFAWLALLLSPLLPLIRLVPPAARRFTRPSTRREPAKPHSPFQAPVPNRQTPLRHPARPAQLRVVTSRGPGSLPPCPWLQNLANSLRKTRQSPRPPARLPQRGSRAGGRVFPQKAPYQAAAGSSCRWKPAPGLVSSRTTPSPTHRQPRRTPPVIPRPAESLPQPLPPRSSLPESSLRRPNRRPPGPAKNHPAAPQEFFGKNSYCARGPQIHPRN